MNRTKFISFIKHGLLTLFFVVTIVGSLNAQELTVIAHTTGAADNLSQGDLEAIFKAKTQRWADGTAVVIAMLKDNDHIADQVYGRTADKVNRFWLQLVFQGKANAPQTFNTAAELQVYVLLTPGAIAVIPTAELKEETRRISVDGNESW